MGDPEAFADWDDVPDDLKVTPERIQHLIDEGAPEWFGRYRDLLSRHGEGGCRAAVRGVGGLFWPCARPAVAGERYCFAHRDLRR